MSRYYCMNIEIKEAETLESSTITSIVNELKNIWFSEGLEIDETEEGKKSIFGGAEGRLCGGEGEEEFSIRVADAVWSIAKKYLPISIKATYLENLPFEEYVFDEKDYSLRTKKKGLKT